ncbi:MAG: site-specific integrase [Bacteroidales bacterium]|jgi:integrase|nr:site-specific integrase [Bacteroidales bacterium]
MYIKKSIRFDVEKRKNNGIFISENRPIKMRISYHGFPRLDIPIGVRIDIQAWDPKTQRVFPGYTNKEGRNSEWINNHINTYNNYAIDAFNRFELVEKKVPKPKEIKDIIIKAAIKDGNRIEKKKQDTQESDFFSLFDEFMQKVSIMRSWSEGTWKKYKGLKERLKRFDPKLSLETITDNDLIKFMKSMFNEELVNSTIEKRIRDTKGFLRWASKNGYYNGNLHNTFSPQLKGTSLINEPTFLTWDELIYLYNLKIPETKNYLNRTRDVFCFCCFTSLRYSDVSKLTKEDIKDNYLIIVTQKTTEGIKIDLNKYSRQILAKYKDDDSLGKKALPIITNQNMNDYLKELGKIAGFNELIKKVYFINNERFEDVLPKHEIMSSHMGRRTFIVNSLTMGIPAEVVMKWTGHEDYEAMKPYIKIVDELKKKEMSKFNKKKINPNFTPKKNDIK